jgi:predicted Rossmann fold nucleotide-binding protein DprA/Smf involved in DNA uptake
VSGLAEGIDEQAHNASLREQVINIAFLGHGINFSIPASTKRARERIIRQGGAVVTEYLPDEHFQKPYFVQRNRLQAALADVVIPVEANPKGGTAHTINFARKYDRRVVGIEWPGANGILEELRSEDRLIVDVFDAAGRKSLDRIFRDLAEQAGHKTYALTVAERRLLSEMQSRDVTVTDVENLIEALHAVLERLD